MEIFNWVQEHWAEVVQIYLGLIGVASILVKLTPTLKDDTWLLSVTKFVAKYLALNINAPKTEDRPK